MADWYVYVVRCGDDSLYTGISTDVVRRFGEHAAQGRRCAKYLRGRGPLELVLTRHVGEKSRALSIELWLKRLSRSSKEALLIGAYPWPSLP